MRNELPPLSETAGSPSAGAEPSAALKALLKANLEGVHERLEAALPAGMDPSSVPNLIAITKSVDPSVALALTGLMKPAHLGENRAESLDLKRVAFHEADQEARWHFVGHIQRNKARRIIERCDVLHSIDSARLAGTVVRLAEELDRTLEVFIEVNLTGETEKYGLAPEDVPAVLDELADATRIQVAGLMAMGPARGLRSVDEVFGDAAKLAGELQTATPAAFLNGTCRLSMGMSGDLEAAVRHGSSYVRIGSALFEGVQALHSSPPQDSSR